MRATFLRSLLLLPLLAVAARPEVAQTSTAGAQSFFESMEVTVVNVDVEVVDADGRPALGLAAADFEVLEDGKPVEITNFSAYEENALEPPAATEESPQSAPAPSAGLAAEPVAPPPATWIFYVDEVALQPGPRGEILTNVLAFFDRSVRPGDRTLVADFDGASLKVLSPLGVDSTVARAAIEKLRKTLAPAFVTSGRERILRSEILNGSTGGGGGRGDPGEAIAGQADRERLAQEIDAIADEISDRALRGYAALRDLLAIVGGLEGRVGLLFANGGFETKPAESLFKLYESRYGANAQTQMRGLDERAAAMQRSYQKTLSAASVGRVTVYSIYAGADRGPGISAEDQGDGLSLAPSVSTANPESSSTVAAIATETGGRSFVGAPDLAKRLERARGDFRTYYSLGYRPPRETTGGRHAIEVRVRGVGLKAHSRRAVFERTPAEEASDAAVLALLSQSPENPFGVTIEVSPAVRAPKGRGSRVPVEVRVPLRGLTLVPDVAAHHARLAFHFALRDPDGGFRRLEPRQIGFDVPNEKLAAALAQYVSMKVDLALEPGTFQLGVSVLDEMAGTTSAVVKPVAVAKGK
ncbi:MAG: VWA domain-containing protein [Thermoanaerobaculia bacterium]